ncbi:hypothetical protein LEP1GSC043_4298 [Leptospira weilii str. Ecochallenge]|uniref:Uncharacterized protein n=2 Tax=Leptospira weilii TaxID=28184 RepID=N1U8N4_9LEPT|nr:hypothetical protein LEP1GSC038_2454 [Leptospira weilii str. 2006001855]EMY14334.1 hypothetical protein LEP1GSC043_4298 [Leptospira weilii str. Ecochallenge]
MTKKEFPFMISINSKIRIGFLSGILFCLLTQCNLKIFDHKKTTIKNWH